MEENDTDTIDVNLMGNLISNLNCEGHRVSSVDHELDTSLPHGINIPNRVPLPLHDIS